MKFIPVVSLLMKNLHCWKRKGLLKTKRAAATRPASRGRCGTERAENNFRVDSDVGAESLSVTGLSWGASHTGTSEKPSHDRLNKNNFLTDALQLFSCLLSQSEESWEVELKMSSLWSR